MTVACLLLALYLPGCQKQTEVPENPNAKTLIEHITWFPLVMGMDYDGFVANYDEILTEQEFKELWMRYPLEGEGDLSEICIRQTLRDGSQILLVFQPADSAWEKFTLVDIEIFPKETG